MEVEKPVEVYRLEGGGCGYEWAELRVYKHPRHSNMFAVFSDSGCSCSYYEDPSVEELGVMQPRTFAEVQRDLQEFVTDNQFYFTFSEGLTAIERWRSTFREMAA